MHWEIVRAILWYLICIIVIVGAAYWVTRYLATRGIGGISARNSGAKIEPLAQLNVGKGERLLLAAVGERYFLFGITAGGISTLAEFTKEEADGWKQTMENQPVQKTMSFAEAMSAVLKKKGRGE